MFISRHLKPELPPWPHRRQSNVKGIPLHQHTGSNKVPEAHQHGKVGGNQDPATMAASPPSEIIHVVFRIYCCFQGQFCTV